MKIIECPRDAMQGLHNFVPTALKIKYINQLLKVGFDTIDFGSFVSPRVIPQLKDTSEVLAGLALDQTKSQLLAIVANVWGAEQTMQHLEIKYIGFPLSLSETFQQRNTNTSIAQALEVLQEIQQLCWVHGKQLVVYLSMGFGNPYGDRYEMELVSDFICQLQKMAVPIISISDTIGVSNPKNITTLFEHIMQEFKGIEFGIHLHSDTATAKQKVAAAYTAGCRRFDGAIKGFGGCPMAEDKLVGNIATESMIAYFESHSIDTAINRKAFDQALNMSAEVFLGG